MAMLRVTLLCRQLRVSRVQQKRLLSGQSAQIGAGSEVVDERELKRRLLDASLKFVPSTGWTAETVALGANELKYPDVTSGLFEDAGASLVLHYIRTKNEELVRHMEDERTRLKLQQPKISFAAFVADAVKHRLQLNIPYMEHMSEALATATRPDQLPQSTKLLLKMSDDICFYGGDRSTNYSWYTKRSSIAGIYAATELYMLQDASTHYDDTWQFMHRRFDDLRYIGQSSRQLTSVASTILDLAYSFYVVGRNTMGANTESQSWRRQ